MAATVLSRAPHSSAEIKSLLAEQIAADRVLIRPIDLIAFAPNASFYRLIPKAVVLAKDETEIACLFQFSQREGIPLTFRAAGSSLSGQSISDGLPVEVARYWKGASVGAGRTPHRHQPCTYGFRTASGYLTDHNQNRSDQMTFLDSIGMTLCCPNSTFWQRETVPLHPSAGSPSWG